MVLGLDLPSNMQVCIFIFFFSLLPFSLSTIIIMRVSTNIIFMNPILSINCVIVMIFYSLSLFYDLYGGLNPLYIKRLLYRFKVSPEKIADPYFLQKLQNFHFHEGQSRKKPVDPFGISLP